MAERYDPSEVTVVDTNAGLQDGQNKCPMCGSTDISLNSKTGKLRCNFCRHEFEPQIEKSDLDYDDITELHGEVIGSGAKDIDVAAEHMITLKCTSCGAEVVIDSSETTQARCHWCRNTLSLNNAVPNGAVPDAVLPFKLNKQEAQKQIDDFVGSRKFFANPKFKQEFTTENIMGVYLPYMVIDVNAHASFHGEGEHTTRRYTEKDGNMTRTYYDADVYEVDRKFDLTIDDLTIESSSDKLNRNDHTKTNNIINSIMPFDTENCVKWDPNYLRGFTSEKRDTNIEELKPLVDTQVEDIARIGINPDLANYDRGVRWDRENVDIEGRSWKTAYLPVWLYSYQEKKGNHSLLHYVAVNARTKETMGSVPIHMPVLILVSLLVEALGLVAKFLVDQMVDTDVTWAFLAVGVIFFLIIYNRYRNTGARHAFEGETKREIFNVARQDTKIGHRTRQSGSSMSGANNFRVNG